MKKRLSIFLTILILLTLTFIFTNSMDSVAESQKKSGAVLERVWICLLYTSYNFAPTEMSKENLLQEGKGSDTIYVTGNTAIDALKTTVRDDYSHPELDWADGSRLIMITAHRRENLGEPMHNMFRAIRRVMDEHPDVKAIYPIHMNPVVRKAADEELGNCDRVHIIEPLEVLDFQDVYKRQI